MGAVRQPDGRPQVLPSDIDSLVTSHGLTVPEAEKVAAQLPTGTDLDALVASTKAARVAYRPTYFQVPATAENHPLVAADEVRQAG